MKSYRVKKKKIQLLTTEQYENEFLNEELIGKSVDFNRAESRRMVLVNSLIILSVLIIAVPVAIFGNLLLGVIGGLIMLLMIVYKLIKSIKYSQKYRNREQAVDRAIEESKKALILHNTVCPSCSKEVQLCMNAYKYECGKCKTNNTVSTMQTTENNAGIKNAYQLLKGIDRNDYYKINETLFEYLKDNPEIFKHKCKCRTNNEFQEAKQQYVCSHCNTVQTLEPKAI